MANLRISELPDAGPLVGDEYMEFVQGGVNVKKTAQDIADLNTPISDTDDLPEGSTNLYFTGERVDDRVAALIQNGTGLSWSYVDVDNVLTGNVSLSAFDTDDLSEGSTNLYFTNARADARIALQKGAANGLATLDAGSKIPSAQLPPIALTDVFVVASQAAQLALTLEEGDVVIRSDESKSYIHNGGTSGTMADFYELLTPPDAVLSVNGQTGSVSLDTDDVAEGVTNKYASEANVNAALSAFTQTIDADGFDLIGAGNIALRNNKTITGRDAGDTSEIIMIYVDGSDRVSLRDNIFLNGSTALFTVNADFDNTYTIKNLIDPVDPQDAVTKNYVDTTFVTEADVSDTTREYTKSQNFDATVLTDAANISWDLESNQVASVTLGGNRTLDNPTIMKDGATYILTVKQDGSGNRTLAFGTAYKWSGGVVPSLSVGGNEVDIFTFISDGTSMFGTVQKNFF